jgi:hypothetical protein
MWLRDGNTIFDVMAWVGHESTATLKRYAAKDDTQSGCFDGANARAIGFAEGLLIDFAPNLVFSADGAVWELYHNDFTHPANFADILVEDSGNVPDGPIFFSATQVSGLPVGTPEPSSFVLCIAGLTALVGGKFTGDRDGFHAL